MWKNKLQQDTVLQISQFNQTQPNPPSEMVDRDGSLHPVTSNTVDNIAVSGMVKRYNVSLDALSIDNDLNRMLFFEMNDFPTFRVESPSFLTEKHLSEKLTRFLKFNAEGFDKKNILETMKSYAPNIFRHFGNNPIRALMWYASRKHGWSKNEAEFVDNVLDDNVLSYNLTEMESFREVALHWMVDTYGTQNCTVEVFEEVGLSSVLDYYEGVRDALSTVTTLYAWNAPDFTVDEWDESLMSEWYTQNESEAQESLGANIPAHILEYYGGVYETLTALDNTYATEVGFWNHPNFEENWWENPMVKADFLDHLNHVYGSYNVSLHQIEMVGGKHFMKRYIKFDFNQLRENMNDEIEDYESEFMAPEVEEVAPTVTEAFPEADIILAAMQKEREGQLREMSKEARRIHYN